MTYGDAIFKNAKWTFSCWYSANRLWDHNRAHNLHETCIGDCQTVEKYMKWGKTADGIFEFWGKQLRKGDL